MSLVTAQQGCERVICLCVSLCGLYFAVQTLQRFQQILLLVQRG
jgi:hypothetical protein